MTRPHRIAYHLDVATLAPLPITLGTATLLADASGALWWPDEATLLVADLHLEKGVAFARKGVLLPPYDTRATLDRLAQVIARFAPRRVIALGDSFHDAQAAAQIDPADRARLDAITAGQDWIWIAGNHDIGSGATKILLGDVALRHEAEPTGAGFEISGHYHPKARLGVHGRVVSCRCFVTDGERIVMPAFGAYAGGLDVGDPALRRLFPRGFTAYLAGRERVTAVPSQILLRHHAGEEPALPMA